MQLNDANNGKLKMIKDGDQGRSCRCTASIKTAMPLHTEVWWWTTEG